MDIFDPARVTVVMPCRNAAAFIDEAIASVLAQTYPEVELIVVDDGSTDDSVSIIQERSAAHPGRITLLLQSSGGPYVARNHGLAHATGNFIAFLDADDYWHPDALAHMHAAMLDTQADVAYCGWQNVGAAARDTQPHVPPNYASADAAALFLKSCPWPINGVLIRRQLLDSLHGFSERLPTAMDYDLWLRLLAAQPTVVRVPEVLAYYRHYPRGAARIPRWRQVLDAVSVREDFVRHQPGLVAHIPAGSLQTLIYGSLLDEAYRCHWRRDIDSSRRLFRRAARKGRWRAKDAKYLLASFLPARLFDGLIRFVDARRAARNSLPNS
ncbi:MAG: glycosyltransferase [Pseudomonadota bacterium]